jgi:hypothetical protein
MLKILVTLLVTALVYLSWSTTSLNLTIGNLNHAAPMADTLSTPVTVAKNGIKFTTTVETVRLATDSSATPAARHVEEIQAIVDAWAAEGWIVEVPV